MGALTDWIEDNISLGGGSEAPHWWKCDESSGNLQDSRLAPTFNTMNPQNTPSFEVSSDIWETGPLGETVGMDGTNEYFSCSDSDVCGTTQSGFVAVSFNAASAGSGARTLLGCSDSAGSQVMTFRIESGGELAFYWYNGFPTNVYSEVSSTVVDDDEWHIAVFVQPRDGSGLQMYLDGALISTTRTLSGSATVDNWFDDWRLLTPTGRGSSMGRLGSFNGQYFQGEISFLLTAADVLTASEVQAMWDAANGGFRGKVNPMTTERKRVLARRKAGRRRRRRQHLPEEAEMLTIEEILESLLAPDD